MTSGNQLTSRRFQGEGLVWLIGVVVCLSCCTMGPIVNYRRKWMAT